MNTILNLKMRRQLFSHLITLVVLVVVVLVVQGRSAQAQTNTTDTTATTTTADVVDSSVSIPAKGTVNDPGGAFTVGGSVIVTAKRVLDNTKVASPIVVLDMDFSGLRGTSSTVKTVYVTGDNHATELRPLQASDTIIVTCPYYDSTKDALSARTMLVTATLNFDINTGKVTGGSISIGNNVVTSQAVGSFTPVSQ